MSVNLNLVIKDNKDTTDGLFLCIFNKVTYTALSSDYYLQRHLHNPALDIRTNSQCP